MIPLQYDLTMTGEAQLRRILRSVENEVVASNRRITNKVAANARAAASKTTSTSASKATNVADREAKRAALVAEKAAAAKIKADEKAADKAVKIAEREWQQKVKIAKAGAREQVAGEERARSRVRADLKKQRKARARSTANMMSGAASSAGRTLRSAVGYTALATGVIGGIGIDSAMDQQVREQRMASQLANQAGKPGIKKQLLDESRQYKGATGEEILSGMGEFVAKTGDLDAARGIMGDLNTLAIATGASLEDLGAAAGAAFIPISDQIKDPIERLNQLKSVMRGIAQQGALGAVEIKDFAVELGPLAAASRAFAGGASGMIRSMGALAQLSVQRGGASSAAEASTAVVRFGQDVVQNQKTFGQQGINVFSDKTRTKLKAPEEILADVADKTKGDLVKLQALNFGERSIRVVQGLMPVYNEAEKVKKGTGRAALLTEFQKFAGADLDEAGLKARAESRLSDPDLQAKEAIKNFNTEVGNRLVPVLIKLIPEFARLLPSIAKGADLVASFVDALVDHPIVGIGGIIAAKITADIGAAALGEVIADVIKKKIEGSAAGGAGGGGGMGLLGAAGVGAAIGIPTAAAIYEQGTHGFDIAHAGTNELSKMLSTMGDADFARNAPLIQQRKQDLEKQSGRSGMMDTLLGMFGGGQESEWTGLDALMSKKLADAQQYQQTGKEKTASSGIDATSFQDLLTQQTAAASAAHDKISTAADKLSGAADKLTTAARTNPIAPKK